MWFSALPYWLLCAGCVISTDYPSDWPKQVVSDGNGGCPDISGTFQEPGVWASEDNDFSLAQYVLGLEVMPDALTISHDGTDVIVFTPSASEDATENRTVYSRNAGDYSCDGGRLWISRARTMDPNAGVGVIIARYKETFGLSKTEDGALVAEYHGGGGGVMLLFGVVPIPSAATGNDYALWRPVETDGKSD